MPPGPSLYYLKGGPCDGNTGQLSPAQEQARQVECKGSLYKEDAADASHRPDIVFKYAGKVPGPPPTGGGTPHTHKGWSDLQHSVNHNLPRSLSRAESHTRAALRSLGRGRKVRI